MDMDGERRAKRDSSAADPSISDDGDDRETRSAQRASSSPIDLQNYCFGSREIERLVCGDDPLGSLELVQRRGLDSWRQSFSSLKSLAAADGPGRAIRVCIATEEIVGPVRNGGIGTTYAFLAEMLGSRGIDVTILYLRGQEVENGTIDQWIEHYAHKGAKFVPVPNYAAADRLQTSADRWLQAPYNMMRYLLEHPMDVVHVSEWRGSGYLSLLAKRQGLAFATTLFIVKTSSPWLWNRLYGSQPLERSEDLTKIYAERQSVELADIVIGGSAHLLRWMASQGYRLPAHRTFVQPNVIFFDHLAELMAKRANPFGSRVAIDEIVFFGRLEARKGIFLFCEAINRLIDRGVALPPSIAFMGKPGARLTARPEQDILEYIETATAHWPCKVLVHTEFQQMEALQYLLGAARLAVMPSIIENSSLAVYEATMCGIPFIASSSGGTPELVLEQDHREVLCDAHPIPLAERIEAALRLGGFVASPSFDNDENLKEWQAFHDALGHGLIEELLATSNRAAASPRSGGISVCIYHCKSTDALRATIASLAEQAAKPSKVVVGLDCSPAEAAAAREAAASIGLDVAFVDCNNYDAGLAFNATAELVESDYVLFLWSGSKLRPEALQALERTAHTSGADIVNFFCRVVDTVNLDNASYLSAPILGSVSEAFFRTDLSPMPVLASRVAFKSIGGFTTDYRVLGCEQEFVSRCQVQGLLCTTALMEMGSVEAWDPAWISEKCYDMAVSQFRMIRPQIAAAPLALRDMLLLSKGFQARGGGGRKTVARRAPPPKPIAEKRANTAFSQLFALIDAPSSDERKRDKPAKAKVAAPRPAAPSASPPAAAAATVSAATARAAREEPAESSFIKMMRQQLHRLPDSDAYTGRLLGVFGTTLTGWVRNELDPDEAVRLDCFRQGRKFAEVVADLDIDCAIPLPKDLRGHGFRFVMPQSLLNRGPLRRPSDVTISIAGTGICLAVTKIGARTLAIGGYDGHCEVVRPGILNGWAWKTDEPDSNIDVAVFIDGHFFVRVPCVREREDLKTAGVGYGNYGFEIALPKLYRDGKRHVVEAVIADVGTRLKAGRLLLEGNALRAF